MLVNSTPTSEAWWPNGQYAGLWIKQSGFEPWPGHCVVFLGETLFTLIEPLSTIGE